MMSINNMEIHNILIHRNKFESALKDIKQVMFTYSELYSVGWRWRNVSNTMTSDEIGRLKEMEPWDDDWPFGM